MDDYLEMAYEDAQAPPLDDDRDCLLCNQPAGFCTCDDDFERFRDES